jgi:hypothetical protein
MEKLTSNSYGIVTFAAFLVTVAMTPKLNFDSLIVPKLIILFTTAMFLLPQIVSSYPYQKKDFIYKFILVFFFFYLVNLIFVMITSEAPIEQQIFGRSGRGLGFLMEFSILIFLLTSFLSINLKQLRYLFLFLIIACIFSSIYSILQRFNLDVFDWSTRTNGIIGTIGNPNFQSSFAAIALVPATLFFYKKRNANIYTLLIIIPIIVLIYIAQSTQGYVASFISVFTLLLIYFWYKNRSVFYFISVAAFISLFMIIQGMLNVGPLSSYLYKVSIRSRGEMLRNSFAVAKDNPVSGVGLDSLGDYYLIYKDQRTVDGINEFTDHAHNSIVNYAATGGFPLAVLNLILIILTLFSIFRILKNLESFNKDITALICAWVCFQAQSMISPATLTLVTWNAIFTGSILGLSSHMGSFESKPKIVNRQSISNSSSLLLLIISAVIVYPYFNVDKMQQDSAERGDPILAVKSAQSYPESTVRYSRIGESLIASNLGPQALELARSAVKFNPNAPSSWVLIYINLLASPEERREALINLKRLDPTNREIRSLSLP